MVECVDHAYTMGVENHHVVVLCQSCDYMMSLEKYGRLAHSYRNTFRSYQMKAIVRDHIIAAVRVGAKAAIGAGVAALATIGVEVDPTVATGLVVLATSIASVALDKLAVKFPVVNKILSFGLSDTGPSYTG